MKKRGLSNIVATVMIVLLVVASVGVIYYGVVPILGRLDDRFEIFKDFVENGAPNELGIEAVVTLPLPAGDIISYWTFDGDAIDEMDNHDGVANGVTFIDDPFGERGIVASFDGIDDYISVGSSWTPTTDMAISVWVHPTSWGEQGKGRIFASHDGQRYYFDGDGDTRIRFSSNDGATKATSAQNMAINEWKHLVVNRIGTNIYFYIDGVLSDSGDPNGGSPILQGDLVFIGSDPSQETVFEGYMDDMFIFNRALTMQEIIDISDYVDVPCVGDICNCTDLQNMRDCVTCDYTLGQNIDCSETTTWNGGLGFEPIGNSYDEYEGNFDGNNFTISHLYINRPSEGSIGLFSQVQDLGSVKNVNLVNIDYTGGSRVGGLAGAVSGDNAGPVGDVVEIRNVHVQGMINSFGGDNGGLIGSMDDAVVESCSADVDVFAWGEEVYPSWASMAGGLIGDAEADDLYMWINNSYATGDVYAYNRAGGLVGSNGADIYNSYATGDVFVERASGYAGGLLGYHHKGNRVDLVNVTSSGDVEGNGFLGGIIGYVRYIGATFDCTWLNHSGNPGASVGSGEQVCGGVDAGFNSDLPIFILDTNGVTIPNDPKILANLTIFYNVDGRRNFITDEPYHHGPIGIETRGQSSQWTTFPKKSYSFETRRWNGVAYEDLDVSLLGFPFEEDWILKGDWFDRTILRNALAYNLSNEVGRYASRTKPVELFFNNSGVLQYDGISELMEKIKPEVGRIDIAKLNPDEISGDDVTGGYILNIDKNDYKIPPTAADYFWTPDRNQSGTVIPGGSEEVPYYYGTRYLYKYPKSEDIVQEQKDYILNYMTEFEDALSGPNFADPVNGYAKYIDVDSFIDHLILIEFTKNSDALKTSTYMYKDKLGKLNQGPVWDFDLSMGNMGYWGGPEEYGWHHDWINSNPDDYRKVPFWWNRLLEDPVFKQKLITRWNELRADELNLTTVFNTIDAKAEEMSEAWGRHLEFWNVLETENTYHTACGSRILYWSAFPTGTNIDEGRTTPRTATLCPNYWEGEIILLKEYLTARAEWVDNNIGSI